MPWNHTRNGNRSAPYRRVVSSRTSAVASPSATHTTDTSTAASGTSPAKSPITTCSSGPQQVSPTENRTSGLNGGGGARSAGSGRRCRPLLLLDDGERSSRRHSRATTGHGRLNGAASSSSFDAVALLVEATSPATNVPLSRWPENFVIADVQLAGRAAAAAAGGWCPVAAALVVVHGDGDEDAWAAAAVVPAGKDIGIRAPADEFIPDGRGWSGFTCRTDDRGHCSEPRVFAVAAVVTTGIAVGFVTTIGHDEDRKP